MSDKDLIENEKYKKPLSPRAEQFIYQLAHKTELLEKENKRLLERLKANEKVAGKACRTIADTLGCCPCASTDDEELADALGCDDICVINKPFLAAYCWFKYFNLDLDQTGDVKDES